MANTNALQGEPLTPFERFLTTVAYGTALPLLTILGLTSDRTLRRHPKPPKDQIVDPDWGLKVTPKPEPKPEPRDMHSPPRV